MYSPLPANGEVKCLILYPLCNVKVESTLCFKNGLSILDSNDLQFWKSYSNQFVDASLFNLSTGNLLYNPNKLLGFPEGVTSWISYEYKGSTVQIKKLVPVEIRTLVSVLICLLQKNKTFSILKSSRLEDDYILYFPDRSTPTGFGLTYTQLTPIFPSLIEPICIPCHIFSEVDRWYNAMLLSDIHLRNRMRVAAFTLPDAIISTGLDRLLKFFMIVDALFGVNGVVGKSFKAGIKLALNNEDHLINDKANRLYKLRCDVAHGDIIFVDEWEGYESYISTFKSDPIDDMLTIVLNSILNYFDIAPGHLQSWEKTDRKKYKKTFNLIEY
ncbi:hypothetical protein [Acetonema longum]|uniref:Apea-like HEPN domain-containing protein n=1 Tax=Acetonema longum DSM 6540 TaxID=1009370 RepID=F7NEK1_9FIRM|nr:hypothetical protein [Acetonema longum]EGO65412.1 hypothetical protein ALO_02321 [Acetonema longum DSM 6540]